MKPGIRGKSQRSVLLFTFLALSLSGCGRSVAHRANLDPDAAWLRDGSIVVARSVPSVTEPRSMLGFVPLAAEHPGNWLSVDTGRKTLSLMTGEKVVASTTGPGIEALTPGSYQLMHKQRNALWYAPDQYFMDRNMTIPPQGDKARFRRGALGDYVLYITKDLPIHNGPLWSPEISGVKLDENEISRIYYQLEIGAPIEVK